MLRSVTARIEESERVRKHYLEVTLQNEIRETAIERFMGAAKFWREAGEISRMEQWIKLQGQSIDLLAELGDRPLSVEEREVFGEFVEVKGKVRTNNNGGRA